MIGEADKMGSATVSVALPCVPRGSQEFEDWQGPPGTDTGMIVRSDWGSVGETPTAATGTVALPGN